MKNIEIIEHEITKKIDESREQMVKKLKDEFLRFGIERDIGCLMDFAEELTENIDDTIYTSAYQLEVLTDALFTVLIKGRAFSKEEANELWIAAQNDENDKFEEFYSLLKSLLKKEKIND